MPVELEIRKLVLELGSSSRSTISLFDFLSKIEFSFLAKCTMLMAEPRFDSRKVMYATFSCILNRLVRFF